MPAPTSRRRLLAAGTALVTLPLAGCYSDPGASRADCRTEAVAHGDGDAIQEAQVATDGEDVILTVTLARSAVDATDRFLVYDSSDTLQYEIPAAGRRSLDQYVDTRPANGRFRIVSRNAAGRDTDELVIDFNCWPADE